MARTARSTRRRFEMTDAPINVLLIEDDPSYPALIRHHLAEAAPKVDLEHLPRLSTALERLGRGGVDVVLLDLMLPGSPGLETLRTVQEAAPRVPIVVITAFEDLGAEAIGEGAQDVLIKGRFDAPRLAESIRHAIERQRAVEARLTRRIAREVFPRTEGERRRLLSRLVAAREQERRRIAGDLHDDPVQVLSSLTRRLRDLHLTLADPLLRDEIDELHEMAANTVTRLRSMLFDLRPPALEQSGLAGAIRLYTQQDTEVFDVQVDDRLGAEPPEELRLIIYRIVQEAIRNIRKHAHPERVEITLEGHDGGYRVTVTDDGVGFEIDQAGKPGHVGLATMRDQAEVAGGWLEVESLPGEGTTVAAWVPAASLAARGQGNGQPAVTR